MLKSDIKAFEVIVDNKGDRATLFCVTYKIGTIGKGYGAEFYELLTSFDNSGFKIPDGSYSFSFKEELRLFNTAALIAPEDRKNIENWIAENMKIAYGIESKIQIINLPKQEQ